MRSKRYTFSTFLLTRNTIGGIGKMTVTASSTKSKIKQSTKDLQPISVPLLKARLAKVLSKLTNHRRTFRRHVDSTDNDLHYIVLLAETEPGPIKSEKDFARVTKQ